MLSAKYNLLMHNALRLLSQFLIVLFLVVGCLNSPVRAFVAKPTDDELRARFFRDPKTFDALKDMFLTDKNLNYVGEYRINNSEIKEKNLSTLLNQAGIDSGQYKRYRSLLDSVGCHMLAYNTSEGGLPGVLDNRNEICFVVWTGDNYYKYISFTVDGHAPAGSKLTENTDAAFLSPLSRTTIMATRLKPHWYIVQSKFLDDSIGSEDAANITAALNVFTNSLKMVLLGMGGSCFGSGLALLYLPDRRKLGFLLIPTGLIFAFAGLTVPAAIHLFVMDLTKSLAGGI